MNPFIDYEHGIIASLFSYYQMDYWSLESFLKYLNSLKQHKWERITKEVFKCSDPFDFDEMKSIVQVNVDTAIWVGKARPNYLATMEVISNKELPTFVFFGDVP